MSSDTFVGLPFNIAQYALLCHLFAYSANMVAEDLVVTLGDAHLYHNHIDAAKTLLSRECDLNLPQLSLSPTTPDGEPLLPGESSVLDFTIDHFTLDNYTHKGAIKVPVAV